MFIDSSVIVSILAREADAETFKTAIAAHRGQLYSSPLAINAACFALADAKCSGDHKVSLADEARHAVNEFVKALGIKEILISRDIGRTALDAAIAHETLGENDCYTYACAKAYRIPVLAKAGKFHGVDLK